MHVWNKYLFTKYSEKTTSTLVQTLVLISNISLASAQSTYPPFVLYCVTFFVPDVNPQCGGYLSGSGSFSSPYYPNYYHDNAHCVWRLSAPSGQRILLTFSDLE